jgi:UDP-N-acetylglucosamine--N-acetylmuramyl-(pentapeptide) pyrophosphoryl-undecaprenol N-acetylglucosamine transferase
MGKATVIIPSVNVTDGHQYKNAKSLADGGAAIMVEESELKNGARVSELLERLYSDADLRAEMSARIRDFADEDVEKNILQNIRTLLDSYKKIVK